MPSLPEVSISFDKTLPLSETNLDLGKLIFSLSEPAPVGGLSVNYNAVDSDGVPDDIDVSTINGTVLFDENGSPSGILIDEGATEARFEIVPKQDNISEGEEFSIVSLLPGNGYTIDPNNNTATFFLTDLPIVTFSVDRTVISEGGESQIFTLQLNEPAPDGGLTVRLQLEDPDGDIGDGGFPPQLFNNISDSNFVVENGKLIQEFTISPGATEASFGFVAGEDNKVEGDETYTLTLLDGEDYSIDAASKPIVSTITEGINFDEQNLTAGTTITNQFDDVEFSSSSEFGVMLFDTNNVTGDDFDLANPDLGNVLIISEDGDSNDPDDNAAGGIINLKFDDLVTVNSIGLLDIDEPGSSIAFYDKNSNLIETVEIESLDNNSVQELDLNIDNVASLDLNLAGSGAVTEINFAATQVSPYSSLYVFGDSSVDTGNLFNATTAIQESNESTGLDIPVLPPSPPYFEGRTSNGQIWIDNLADKFNIDLIPASELSFASPDSDILSPVTIVDGNPVVSPFFNGNTTNQSVNFGYGSATTGSGGGGTGELGSFVPGMEQQVDFFIADHLQANQTADPDALYVLWAGSNDYLALNADPEQVVDNIEAQIGSLYDFGGHDFLVVNIPDLGELPEASNPNLSVSPEELSELSDTHNSLLDSTVDELEDTLTGVNITVLDVNSLLDDVIANPEEFGLTNVTEPFLDPLTLTPTVGANPDEYLFYDTIHPTVTGYTLVSDLALETLAVEAEY